MRTLHLILYIIGWLCAVASKNAVLISVILNCMHLSELYNSVQAGYYMFSIVSELIHCEANRFH